MRSSQNLRRVEVGRDHWRSCGPTPLLRQGHLEHVALDPVHGLLSFVGPVPQGIKKMGVGVGGS